MDIIQQIEGLVSSKLSIIKIFFSMLKLEARLAGLSVFPLLLTVSMLFVVIITVWLSSMFLLFYFLATKIFYSPIFAIFFILVLNLSLVLVLIKYLIFNINKMSFEKTRKYFLNRENHDHEQPKKAINKQNNPAGANITK